MSDPTINNVQQVSPVLTNMLLGYQQDEKDFVAARAFPYVPVDNDNGTYYTFDIKYFTSDEMKNRAPGGEYPHSGFKAGTDTFTTLQWALAYDLPDEVKANNQIPMQLEQIGAIWLAQKSLIRKERLFASTYMTTSVWGTDDTTATDWDDYSASDPVGDILTAKRTVKQDTGKRPNTMIMGEIVWDALVNHPDIIDRIKYQQTITGKAVEALMPAVFGVDRILVSGGFYNTANEYTTASLSAIIDDDCLVCYVDPGAGLFAPSAGKVFTWAPGGGAGSVSNKYRDHGRDSDVIKAKEQWVMKVVSSACGYFFSDIV